MMSSQSGIGLMATKRPTLHLHYSEEATKAGFDRTIAKMQAALDLDPATHCNAALLHKALRYRRKSHVSAATTNELYDRWGVKWHKVEKEEARTS